MSGTMQCWVLVFDGICVSAVSILVILVVVIFFFFNAWCVSYFFGWQFVISEPVLRLGLFLPFICDSRRIRRTSFITFGI